MSTPTDHPNMTRRALLRGTPAALAALALPTIATAATEPTAAPPKTPALDAELLRLEAEWITTGQVLDAAIAARDAAIAALPEWAQHEMPQYGDLPALFGALFHGTGNLTLPDIRQANWRTEGIVAHWQDIEDDDEARDRHRREFNRRRRQGRARVRWWRERVAAIEHEQQQAGIPGLDAECNRLWDLCGEIEAAIVTTKVESFVGLAVKLRVGRAMQTGLRSHAVKPDTDESWDWEFAPTIAALRDAERLAGETATRIG